MAAVPSGIGRESSSAIRLASFPAFFADASPSRVATATPAESYPRYSKRPNPSMTTSRGRGPGSAGPTYPTIPHMTSSVTAGTGTSRKCSGADASRAVPQECTSSTRGSFRCSCRPVDGLRHDAARPAAGVRCPGRESVHRVRPRGVEPVVLHHSAAADHRRCGAPARPGRPDRPGRGRYRLPAVVTVAGAVRDRLAAATRSEEHTSELQSRGHLVCRLLLEKKKKIY